jgi:hypothetical protein
VNSEERFSMDPFSESRTNYLAAAFSHQYNVILLGGAALFALASASILPLAAGVAGEAVWLAIGPRLPAFRRWVDSRARGSGDVVVVQDQLVQAMETLDGEHNGRLLRLGALLGEIRGLASQARGPGAQELHASVAELEAVRPAFLRLCQLHQRLSLFLSDASVVNLETEQARLKDAFAKEKDLSVRVTLRQAVSLVDKRIEHRERMAGVRRTATLRLEMIESALSHVRSHGMTLTSPRDLAGEIHTVIQQLHSVSSLEQEAGEAAVSARLQPPHSAQAISYPG